MGIHWQVILAQSQLVLLVEFQDSVGLEVIKVHDAYLGVTVHTEPALGATRNVAVHVREVCRAGPPERVRGD